MRFCPSAGCESEVRGGSEATPELTCRVCGVGFCFLHNTAHAPGRAWVAYAAGATPRTMLRGWLAALAALGRPAADAGRLLAQWEAAGWDLSVSGLEEEGWRVSLVGVPPKGA